MNRIQLKRMILKELYKLNEQVGKSVRDEFIDHMKEKGVELGGLTSQGPEAAVEIVLPSGRRVQVSDF